MTASRAGSTPSLEERIARERAHAANVLSADESNWGWNTAAGRIRKQRRIDYLLAIPHGKGAEIDVLEVGCGTGTFTGELAGRYGNLIALDVADELLVVARQRHPDVRFLNEDIHRTKFPSDSFDAVIGCSVLHHLDWTAALREIYRILRPGGVIRFSEPNRWNPQIYLQKNWRWLKKRLGDSPDESAFTAHQIRTAMAAAGFRNLSAEPFEFLHPSTPPFAIPAVIALESAVEKTPLRKIAGSLRIEGYK